MKTVPEGIRFIKEHYMPNDEIPYDAFDEFLEISGVPWIERQSIRRKYAMRLNTVLKNGEIFGEDRIHTSLYVNERGKSFILVPFTVTLLKGSQRTYDSISSQLDDMCREYARALGYPSYESHLNGHEIKFRGERALLTAAEVQQLERHYDVLTAITPLLKAAEHAKNNAAACLNRLIGSRLLEHHA